VHECTLRERSSIRARCPSRSSRRSPLSPPYHRGSIAPLQHTVRDLYTTASTPNVQPAFVRKGRAGSRGYLRRPYALSHSR